MNEFVLDCQSSAAREVFAATGVSRTSRRACAFAVLLLFARLHFVAALLAMALRTVSGYQSFSKPIAGLKLRAEGSGFARQGLDAPSDHCHDRDHFRISPR
jgi:hypothetical protein